MNDTTQTIEEEDNDNRRASISNFENNRVALQCATQYVICHLKLDKTNEADWEADDILVFADRFKKWLNEA